MKGFLRTQDELSEGLWEQAQSPGVEDPVFTVLSPSSQGLAVLADILGTPPEPVRGPKGAELARLLALPLNQATGLLRRHCGVGGVAAAATLEQPQGQEWWMLCVGEGEVRVSPFRGGEELWARAFGCDELGVEGMAGLHPLARSRVAAARGPGATDSVLLLLPPDPAQAATIRAAIDGAAGAGAAGSDEDCLRVAAVADACRLLRQHAGRGGGAVAQVLEDGFFARKSWVVALGKAAIEVTVLEEGHTILYSSFGYDTVPRRLKELTGG